MQSQNLGPFSHTLQHTVCKPRPPEGPTRRADEISLCPSPLLPTGLQLWPEAQVDSKDRICAAHPAIEGKERVVGRAGGGQTHASFLEFLMHAALPQSPRIQAGRLLPKSLHPREKHRKWATYTNSYERDTSKTKRVFTGLRVG